MAHKQEALVILLDAGPSMRLPLREKFRNKNTNPTQENATTATRFDAAIETIENIIQQKVRWWWLSITAICFSFILFISFFFVFFLS
jgi:hypothetical protein